MQVLTTYNSITSGFDIPLSEVFMSPTGTTGISDDFRLLTEWDARTSVASGATAVLTADSFGGEVTITGVSAGGGHLELKTAAFAAAAGKPVFMLSRVKVTTAGQYFIGLTQKVAANSAVSSATQIVAGSVHDCRWDVLPVRRCVVHERRGVFHQRQEGRSGCFDRWTQRKRLPIV